MPLKKGKNGAVISTDIEQLVKGGRVQKQAVQKAMKAAGKGRKKTASKPTAC